MKSREIKDGPFCWASKDALNLIRNSCEQCGSALLVYQALYECASNAGQEEFDTTHVYLAGLCGLTEKTVRVRLRELEDIGLVNIQPNESNGFRRPSTFTLLRCKRKATQHAAITSKTLEKEAKAYAQAHEAHLL